MTLRCSDCACAAVVAVRPGREDERAAAILPHRGVPDRAWCAACWPMRPIGEVVRPILERARKRQRRVAAAP